MSAEALIQSVELGQLKEDIPAFGPGDTVRVHAKVVEGERERIQVFEGVVIRRRSGGVNENFTVRRTASHGIGVERTFLVHSPRIDRIEVMRSGRVRRAKLYYLRSRTGRAARIRERRRPDPTMSLKGRPKAYQVEAPIVDEVVEATEVEETEEVSEDVVAADAQETTELVADDSAENVTESDEVAAVDGSTEADGAPTEDED